MPMRRRFSDGDEGSRSGCSKETISADRVEGLYFISARAWIVDGEEETGWREMMALSINSEVEAARLREAQSA